MAALKRVSGTVVRNFSEHLFTEHLWATASRFGFKDGPSNFKDSDEISTQFPLTPLLSKLSIEILSITFQKII